MSNTLEPKYDFDVHPPLSFMHYFTKQYMEKTHETVVSAGIDLKGKTLHDIGIGRGRSLAVFKALGIDKVIGFDLSQAETQFVQTQAKRLGLDVAVVIDSSENDQLKAIPSNSVEVAALMNILFCVRDEQTRKTIISEAKRILKIGGILIIVDMIKPSFMSLFSFVSRKPWTFRRQKELLQLMSPLSLIASAPSNHFYFANKPIDFINKIVGFNVCYPLDRIARVLRIPSSTRTYLFTKLHEVAL